MYGPEIAALDRCFLDEDDGTGSRSLDTQAGDTTLVADLTRKKATENWDVSIRRLAEEDELPEPDKGTRQTR
ncbi:MAG: hypothetical protein U5N86_05405 [Planctomycetota bacterium]|nr:hypothetical protein [Planctomycetota bacterium]